MLTREQLASGRPGTPNRTLHSDPDAEARIGQDLSRLGAAIDSELGDQLIALLLIGAYARGEGSVIEQAGEHQAASAYELLALVDKTLIGQRSRIDNLATRWSDELQVEVRLHLCTPAELPRLAATLTWTDIGRGYLELLSGRASILEQLPSFHPNDLPPEASAWLLFDAAFGLACSNLQDGPSPKESTHAALHLHHAALLCGDALLLRNGHYCFDVHERASELALIEASAHVTGLAASYADAIEHQTRPDRWQLAHGEAKLAAWCERARARMARTHLAIESARLGRLRDVLDYALFADRLWSATPFVRHQLLQSALRALRAGDDASFAVQHGDELERVTRAAVLLAYAPERQDARRLAAQLLGVGEKSANDRLLRRQLIELQQRVRAHDPLAGARYARG